MSQLTVIVDGRRVPEDEARALWMRFSAHMDAHRGDFEGFAAAEGYASAAVAVAGGTPTLSLTTEGADWEAERGAQRRAAGETARGAADEPRAAKRGVKQQRAQMRPDDGRGGSAPPRKKR